MVKRLARGEVPVEETWNLDDLFPSVNAWEAELAAVEAGVPGVTAFRGKLAGGPGVLLACLEAAEALEVRLMRVGTYARLQFAEDGTSPVNQAAAARVGALAARASAELSFVSSEILELPEGTIERYLAQEPKLASFRRVLENLLEHKPHRLASETEAALAALGEVLSAPYNVYSRSKSADMEFDPFEAEAGASIPNSFALYESQYEQANDAGVRRRAFASFVRGLKRYQNTFAATFAAEISKNIVLARVRRHETATHLLLHSQQVPIETYSRILDTIQAELAPHMRRLAKLRQRVLGLDKLYYCDIKAPLTPEDGEAIGFDAASRMVLEALAVLGPEYGEIMRAAFQHRWIDRSDNIGKSTGAFCASPYGAHSYILMTWTGTMRCVFTLAHELGHAGHFMLAMRSQRAANTRPSMFFVEGPSTMNEVILGNHILARSDDRRARRQVIMQLLGTFHHNFVTHLLEGELQRHIYALAEKGIPVTAKLLGETKGKILEAFWGDTVAIDEGARLTWMRQPHYYMGLYPYTYAAGLTAAVAVNQRMRQEGSPAVDRWLQALKAGGALKPMDLMQLAGVDMTGPAPIKAAVAYVGSLVDQLEASF
ncbi:MAG TPA: oligoendopeptidase F [Clostridiales bacterium]|nr:oligoendopeptidase F [Clostridiales bacterium]